MSPRRASPDSEVAPSRARILGLLCDGDSALEPVTILGLLSTAPLPESGPERLARILSLRSTLRIMAADGLVHTDGFDRWRATDRGHEVHLRARTKQF